METGRNLGREKNGATKILQYLGPREKNDFGQLYAHNPQLEGTQFKQEEKPDSYLNMDYEMHLGTKIDYLFFQNSRLLQATEIQLLQNMEWRVNHWAMTEPGQAAVCFQEHGSIPCEHIAC